MSDLAAALKVAIRVHADQRDKQGQPYLLHVLRVVEAVSDEAKVVAALHDVVEDGSGSWGEVATQQLLAVDEAQALGLLTRYGQSYSEYIAGIARAAENEITGGKIAREVKLADLRDNLGRIPPSDHYVWRSAAAPQFTSLRQRYEKAIATLEAEAVVSP